MGNEGWEPETDLNIIGSVHLSSIWCIIWLWFYVEKSDGGGKLFSESVQKLIMSFITSLSSSVTELKLNLFFPLPKLQWLEKEVYTLKISIIWKLFVCPVLLLANVSKMTSADVVHFCKTVLVAVANVSMTFMVVNYIYEAFKVRNLNYWLTQTLFYFFLLLNIFAPFTELKPCFIKFHMHILSPSLTHLHILANKDALIQEYTHPGISRTSERERSPLR